MRQQRQKMATFEKLKISTYIFPHCNISTQILNFKYRNCIYCTNRSTNFILLYVLDAEWKQKKVELGLFKKIYLRLDNVNK